MSSIPARWFLLLFCTTMSWLLSIISIILAPTGIGPRPFAISIAIVVFAAWAVSKMEIPRCSSEQIRRTIPFITISIVLFLALAIGSFVLSFFIEVGDSRLVLIGASLSPLFILLSLDILKSELEASKQPK